MINATKRNGSRVNSIETMAQARRAVSANALQPEGLKGLGYLGSIYSDEGAWKHMRKKDETIKRGA